MERGSAGGTGRKKGLQLSVGNISLKSNRVVMGVSGERVFQAENINYKGSQEGACLSVWEQKGGQYGWAE